MGVQDLESSPRVFRFSTSPKKKVSIEEDKLPIFVTTTSFNINAHLQPPTLTTTTSSITPSTTTTALITLATYPSKEKMVKPARAKENTPLGVYENTKSKPGSSSRPDIEYHYGVRNVKSGELDVYAKPVPSATVINKTGNALALPPELPPRNTPQSSPRHSVAISQGDYDKPGAASDLNKTGEEG